MTPPEDIARNEHAPITRAEAPVSGISIPAHLGIGTDLVDPLDYVVLIQVMFDVSSGRKITPVLVWQRLQERGIRSTKHRSELVGKNAVYDSFGRLIEAGYMQRYNLPNEKHPGRKGPIGYRVFDNPAWNPDWQARQVGSDPLRDGSVKPQVGMLPQYRDDLKPEESRDGKVADGNASPVPGSPVPGSQNQGSGSRGIPAGRNASPVPGSPPHPPEGGGNTSPSPHKTGRAAKWAAQCALDPEDYVPTAEEIKAADDFLQGLPGKWQMSLEDARALAPLLASRTHALGIELDLMLEIELMADDPKDPVRVASRVMPTRIRNLKRRTEGRAQDQTSGGLADWCGECNQGEFPMAVYQRIVELPDGTDVPCKKCHPKHARTRS